MGNLGDALRDLHVALNQLADERAIRVAAEQRAEAAEARVAELEREIVRGAGAHGSGCPRMFIQEKTLKDFDSGTAYRVVVSAAEDTRPPCDCWKAIKAALQANRSQP